MSQHPTIPILVLLLGAAGAAAQCVPEWSGNGPADPGAAHDMVVYDVDGPGPARPVLIGVGSWGTRPADRYLVTRFDGRAWRRLGDGLGQEGSIGAVYKAHSTGVGSPAPGVYAGGNYRFLGEPLLRFFSYWDGLAWHDMPGIRGPIRSLLVFDEDGPGPNGPNLFVGGGIAEIAGLSKPGLARWDGASFSLVGGSLQPIPGLTCYVSAMTIFDDDGPGPRPPALYVAGSFQTAGGLVVNNIARWDGQNWEALDLGIDSGIRALAVFDDDGDGPGLPMLYAAGRFRKPGGNHSSVSLSRWDGAQWTEMPGYGIASPSALHVFDDDGDGPNKPALFVSGSFNRINGVLSPGLVKWDGTQWLAVGGGLGGVNRPFAYTMTSFDEDGDPATPPGLYVGGSFLRAGSSNISAVGLARWGCPLSTCYVDCDASTGLNVLDIFDFLCFQDRFLDADPYACDCDQSSGYRICDMLDFLCFQRAFVAGCP